MGYYIIRGNVQEGTRQYIDKSRIYRYIRKAPRPGVIYKIPAPTKPINPSPSTTTKYKYVYARKKTGTAIRVWDRSGFVSKVRPGSRFIPVPQSLRCADVRVVYYEKKMFDGWVNPANIFEGWTGNGCYAAPKSVLDEIEAAAHAAFKHACIDMSKKGWNKVYQNADCLDVRVVFEPDKNFGL